MKQFYLFLLLFSFLCPASAQNKYEFALVVKTGRFTTPYLHKHQSDFPGGKIITGVFSQNAGAIFAFGVKESLRIGGHFRVSGELMYRYANYVTGVGYDLGFPNAEAYLSTAHKQQVGESSLSLPVKLHFSFRRNGRTTIAVGAGVSRLLRTQINTHYVALYTDSSKANASSSSPSFNLGRKDFKPEIGYIAGLYQRINQSTLLGLELNYERHVTSKSIPVICNCYGYEYLETPSMRSISISLSHILSRR